MNRQENGLLRELVTGILVYAALVQAVLFFLGSDVVYLSAGLWIGAFLAVGMIIHMKYSLETALDLGEAGAEKHVRKTYAIRLAALILVFGVTFYFRIGSMLTAFIGVMGLKISAYSQPHMHKIFHKFEKSE